MWFPASVISTKTKVTIYHFKNGYQQRWATVKGILNLVSRFLLFECYKLVAFISKSEIDQNQKMTWKHFQDGPFFNDDFSIFANDFHFKFDC